MIRALTSFFMVAAFIFLPGLAQAQSSPIGTLIEVEGDSALVMRAAEQGKSYPAKAEMDVFIDDVLQTGIGGRMLVMLLDDSRFTLGENARLKVDEYVYDDEDNSANMARYNVLQGTFLYVSGLIAKKENPDVKIGTPYGSIGLRGTTVWGGTLDSAYSVFVDDGEVTIETNRGRIRVAKGEGTSIRNINAIPERAKTWGAGKVTRAKDTIGLRNIERVKERVAAFQNNREAMMSRYRTDIRAKRQNTPLTSRGTSTKEMRPQHQRPETPDGEQIKNKGEKGIGAKRTEGQIRKPVAPNVPHIKGPDIKTPDMTPGEKTGDATQMPFPKPALNKDAEPKETMGDLPSDPARRQEILEQRTLQHAPKKVPERVQERPQGTQRAAPIRKLRNPFE